MSEVKHTPGPWGTHSYAGTWDITSEVDDHDRYAVAEVDMRSPNAEANAHLMAAAPEILEELESLVDMAAASGTHESQLAGARAAIAKAKGLA